jgi:retron-type reverse transcriptase
LRQIHKAGVKDRVLNHAVYRQLYPFFDKTFIHDSYSCRKNKGTHAAVGRMRKFANQSSQNNSRTCWILKCDIRKFFASIDQTILLKLLDEHITDKKLVGLLKLIIKSFRTNPGKGLPLGNLTSQLFVNIYMNEFDQFVKHRLKVKYYIRYADDFVLVSRDQNWLIAQIPLIQDWLIEKLDLELHPNKITLKTFASGIDFLGYTLKPNCTLIRTKTKNRMLINLDSSNLASYLGVCKHANTYELQDLLLNSSFGLD